jgi:hypothetical protein
MKLLSKYTNGNFTTEIFDDGTKIRRTEDDHFDAVFPECIDIKITNYCDLGCPFCHENSTTTGRHGNIMTFKFIDTLRPYTELAIGGGNPLAHPDLIPFLKKLREKNIIANLTVNSKHIGKYDIPFDLIFGLGISVNNVLDLTEDVTRLIRTNNNVVIHTIAGIADSYLYDMLGELRAKVLILGYKSVRRGIDFENDSYCEIAINRNWLVYDWIEMTKKCKVVCFDNLALEQLNVKNTLVNVLKKPEVWERQYMGDDGNFTMYIDAVDNVYSVSSTLTNTRVPLTGDIVEMFTNVKNIKKNLDVSI